MARLAGSARWGASILKQQELYREFRALGRRLAEIDARFKSGCLIGNATVKRVADPSSAELCAASLALDEVNRFLSSVGISSRLLTALCYFHLSELRHGITTPMLTVPKAPAGRKGDSPIVALLKGRIAGIARIQIGLGKSRDDAAAWVARKISPALASRLSSKPIKASTVKEWMERFDCGTDIFSFFLQKDGLRKFESLLSDSSTDGVFRREEFLHEHVPQNKSHHSANGLMGFMMEAYFCFFDLAEGTVNCDHLLAKLEREAAEFWPAPGSEDTALRGSM
jgi:hypothetical protein